MRWVPILIVAAGGLTACSWMPPPPAVVPLRVVEDGPESPSDTVVVFLRGRFNRPEEFASAGLFELARRRWPDGRFVAPDLHLGYYLDRSAAVRLREDVVAPAHRAGTTHLVVVGVSLGGLGALLYDLEYPGEVDEIILLAPYLGEDKVWREIESAGGLARWDPGAMDPLDHSRRLWASLRRQWLGAGRQPEVFIACGQDDGFLIPNQLFAKNLLQPDHAVWVPGGHKWSAWREGFVRLLADGEASNGAVE